ncbi:unnamed protein product [Pieris brassicae]|uniref:Hcy-binding domain-containing protein n=1 Tax=Pieris brassicae TaxID=7116 RepID=A0A9P0TCQ9_PIEBR|nr:unnamed protein product [Pieris brassicae]
MLKEYPATKGWISFCCKDNMSIAHGEHFSKVVMNCLQANPVQILAVGINCCSPKLVSDLITSLEVDIPIVTYPNSGEKFIPGHGWADDQCQPLHSFKVFGVSVNKKKNDDKIKRLLIDNDALRTENLSLSFEISKLKKDNGKLKDENFSDYLSLMRERDARYTLYFENLSLHLKLKELDNGMSQPMAIRSDPTILRIALDRCRKQLSSTQSELKSMKEEYAETVPRRDFEHLEGEHQELQTQVQHQLAQYEHLQSTYRKVTAHKNSIEEELMECRERCRELERAGTPRPPWDLCADFIGGGKKRWCQLTEGLSSRDKLRALLKELGPAAESEHLEYFDGLGTDPAVPPYLRYSGRVRNLRLSRREVRVVVNDVWRGRPHHPHLALQDFVTKYFEDRYQQSSVRAEWAYNVCAGAESMLDEPQVRVWWGALHGQLSEQVYWGLRRQWDQLQQHLRRQALDGETITIEEFERVSRSIFPLKSEVDIKNLTDVVKKQLKIKLNCNEINLDKLFYENEEGFDRVELARELFRQRQLGQDKYIREVVAELGGRRAQRNVTVDALKRAFAIVDPAIDHVRMEQYIRWAFSDQSSEISAISPLSLQNIVVRLAAGDIERVGPRSKGVRRNYNKH